MTIEELAALGITKDDILNKLVDQISDRLVGSEDEYAREFEKRLQDAAKNQINACFSAAMEKHVIPKVKEMTENICFQATTSWGEKKGAPLSFVEYLVQRADAFIREEVDYRGNPKGSDSYNWSAKSTRIAHMIHEHLDHHIQEAMKKAVGSAHVSIANGINDAVRMAINNLKVTVNTEVKS